MLSVRGLVLSLGVLATAASVSAQEAGPVGPREVQRRLDAGIATMRSHCTAPRAVGANVNVRVMGDGDVRVEVHTWPRADATAEACLDTAVRRVVVPLVAAGAPRPARATLRITRLAPSPAMDRPFEGDRSPGRLSTELPRISELFLECQRLSAPSFRGELTVTIDVDARGRTQLADVVLPPGLDAPALVTCARERIGLISLAPGAPEHLVAPITLVRGPAPARRERR